jgi:hypothetical protein
MGEDTSETRHPSNRLLKPLERPGFCDEVLSPSKSPNLRQLGKVYLDKKVDIVYIGTPRIPLPRLHGSHRRGQERAM